MGPSRPLFLYFRLFYLIVQLVDKLCGCWDLNRGYLMSEATVLSTEPPPLPSVLETVKPAKVGRNPIFGFREFNSARIFFQQVLQNSGEKSC